MEPDEVIRRLDVLRAKLDTAGAEYEILPHATTYHSAEDGVAHGVGSLAEMAPTFILRTKRGLRDVSMADPQTVLEETGAEVGYVSQIQPDIATIVDERLLQTGECYGGCGVPKHTLRIKVADLVRITGAKVFDFTEPKSGN